MSARSVLIYQYGDYRAAYHRLQRGAAETYLDQRRSVLHVARLAPALSVTVVSQAEGAAHDEALSDGLRAIGVPEPAFQAAEEARAILANGQADMLVLRTPHEALIRAAQAANVPVFCSFADIFRPVSMRDVLTRRGLGRLRYNRRMARALALPAVTLVGNHGRSASETLHSVLGVDPERIVPWEFSRQTVHGPVRDPLTSGALRVLYAGVISVEKGTGDLVAALKLLAAQGVPFSADILGDGPLRGALARDVAAAGLADRIRFGGAVSNAEVHRSMGVADAVVVPSRHSYPEGMPNVIFEALAGRAPLVVTDHPSFGFARSTGNAALVVPERRPAALAAALARLAEDGPLRAALSERAPDTLKTLYVGAPWYDVLDRFVADPRNESGWVAPLSLARL